MLLIEGVLAYHSLLSFIIGSILLTNPQILKIVQRGSKNEIINFGYCILTKEILSIPSDNTSLNKQAIIIFRN